MNIKIDNIVLNDRKRKLNKDKVMELADSFKLLGQLEPILVDINKMRDANLFSEQRKVTMNTDGYTGFITYTIEELEYNNCIIAKNKDICEK